MRVTREQAAANREMVIEAAGVLFREHGFDGVGVVDIMKGAGLTHGGFYGQFASKDDLIAETCTRLLGTDGWAEKLTGSSSPSLAAFVRAYLSTRHRDDPGDGCFVAAIGGDMARQPRTVRRAFTDGFKARVAAFAKLVPGGSAAARRKKALATLTGLVGAVMLARAVDDAALSEEILKAAAATYSRS